jgi:hypothetical protein
MQAQRYRCLRHGVQAAMLLAAALIAGLVFAPVK